MSSLLLGRPYKIQKERACGLHQGLIMVKGTRSSEDVGPWGRGGEGGGGGERAGRGREAGQGSDFEGSVTVRLARRLVVGTDRR